jgi:4-hydroxy-tetrahydrodipicolinate reductase
MTERIRVVVAGAAGRMGKEAVKAISAVPDLELVGCLTGRSHVGEDAGSVAGMGPIGLPLETDLAAVLQRTQPGVLVDLTLPHVVASNLDTAAAHGIHTVVGTTGLPEDRLAGWDQTFKAKGRTALICPNFALGAILMIEFAKQAARYFPDSAIVEWHHAAKVDAPSGTALRTAQAIGDPQRVRPANEAPSLGERIQGVPVHSIRLPGLLAHQEVVFGGPGQVLTIRHDALSRECYMPGLLLAVRQVHTLSGLVVGLEHLIQR